MEVLEAQLADIIVPDITGVDSNNLLLKFTRKDSLFFFAVQCCSTQCGTNPLFWLLTGVPVIGNVDYSLTSKHLISF